MRVPIPAIVVPVICLVLYFFVPGVRQQPWTALRIAGAITAVFGYVLFIVARLQLGSSFSVSPQAKGLVTHGLYSKIRNPIGMLLMQVIRSRREAKVLTERFGQAYLDYRHQTWF